MQPFIFKKVEPADRELMEQIHRLRFEVYCRECNFIQEDDYPQGVEKDAYDAQSVHFAALDPEGLVIGTMRMILSGKLNFPLESHCPNINVNKNTLPRNNLAEISRLVISKNLRRRCDDGMYYGPQTEDKQGVDKNGSAFLRRAKPMAFGLYRELYRESKKRGITHWYALMEKGLWLLLRIHGFAFEPIGEEVNFYGMVKPYLGQIAKIEEEVRLKFPKFFGYFTEDIAQETSSSIA